MLQGLPPLPHLPVQLHFAGVHRGGSPGGRPGDAEDPLPGVIGIEDGVRGIQNHRRARDILHEGGKAGLTLLEPGLRLLALVNLPQNAGIGSLELRHLGHGLAFQVRHLPLGPLQQPPGGAAIPESEDQKPQDKDAIDQQNEGTHGDNGWPWLTSYMASGSGPGSGTICGGGRFLPRRTPFWPGSSLPERSAPGQ